MFSLEVNLSKHEIQNTKTKLKVIKILFVSISTSIPDRGLESIAQDKCPKTLAEGSFCVFYSLDPCSDVL